MKKNILILSFLAGICISCQKFDTDDLTALDQDFVGNSYDYAINRATAVYTHLPDGFLYIDGAMMASASDEAEHTIETSEIHKFNTGAWGPLDNPDNVWSHYYSGIRKANQFLETADDIDYDIHRLDPDPNAQEIYERRLAEIERLKYEVRFLRAFFYFELVKRYGGVPLITQTLELEDDYEDTQRNSLAESIEFVLTECDLVAEVLPIEYPNPELGRITKGSALALKSRLLLYAASDLFNNSSWASSSNSELISLSGDRQEKWKMAADAAKAVIDLNTYSLSTSYSSLFNSSNYDNSEIILVRRNGASNAFERMNYPIGYDPGQGGTNPSQNLVDAYEMKDGGEFSWSNPEHASNPYSNRDPRLAFTVLTNNTMFKDREVEIWTGGRDGKGIDRATETGYYLKKYVNSNLNLLEGQESVHSWVLIRLGEIYLNYAEALNEYDPGNEAIKRHLDLVRNRPGVEMPPIPDGLSQTEMRERIRNERRVELAFENHRFWDVRRWMEGSEYFDVPLRGVEITRNGEEFLYEPVIVENRVFEPRMYFYPIPEVELIKIPGMEQNPLW